MIDLNQISIVIAGVSLVVSLASLRYSRIRARTGEEELKIEKKRESKQWYGHAIISDLQMWQRDLPAMIELHKAVAEGTKELDDESPAPWVLKQTPFIFHRHKLRENYNIILPEKDLWNPKQVDELIDYVRQTVLIG